MNPTFELTRQSAKLASYTPRRELHGEDPQPAATLHFAVTLPAHQLAMFHPTLAGILFTRPDGNADLADAGTEYGAVRFPEVTNPMAWSREIIGAELTIHYGIGKSDLVLPECNVDRFTIAPQAGGVAIVTFRTACHPDERQSGKLAMMIAEDVEITLTPPEPVADLASDKPLAPAGDDERASATDRRRKPGRREAKAAAQAAFQ